MHKVILATGSVQLAKVPVFRLSSSSIPQSRNRWNSPNGGTNVQRVYVEWVLLCYAG
jgi:hypothetical protein